MCGRMHLAMPFRDIAILMDITGPAPNSEPDYNIGPTKKALVVYLHPVTRDRISEPMRWGMIPRWAKAAYSPYTNHLARAETVDQLATFRAPWREGKRCLIVTEGFYEWKKSKTNPKNKQPFAIAKANSPLTVVAGLWEQWRDPQNGEILKSCAMITVPANSLIAPMNERMPVILRADQWAKWLGQEPAHEQELKDMLRPYPAEDMTLWPVSKRVGNVRNNDAELLTPVEIDLGEFGD
ncbi:MAG TPA: SOS response-associated peptidase [Alphaproteobacteria bacterium]|nr:SOS response-associated peptidase [Alphaproteobacteria bacterium]